MYVSVSERFIKCAEYLIESRKLRNQTELRQALGLSKGYVSQIMTGKREPSETIVSNLCARFPELNPIWIMTGEGEMLQELQVLPGENFVDPHTVPLLPIFAQAGHLTGWSEGVEEVKCERVISPVQDVDMAVHIYGESMYPDIPNGSVVYVRRVSGRIIDFGHAYILDTVDGPVLKYLTPGSDDEHLTFLSANKDPKFAPYEVLKSDILGLYKVVMCMRMM
jgi:hypothetical protein